ncbi:MAG: hypothetical protein WCC17_02325 [Candidatus Nitrosopolaris sp.]
MTEMLWTVGVCGRPVKNYQSFNMNESPNHLMILDAIGSRDMTNINNIAKVTKLNNKIELIVNVLFNQRFVR